MRYPCGYLGFYIKRSEHGGSVSDFPEWMINSLDQEASKIGVTRQSIIKFWISEKLRTA